MPVAGTPATEKRNTDARPLSESEQEAVRRIKAEAAVQVCPSCGKKHAVPVFYGLVSPEGIEHLRNVYDPQGYALGGCFGLSERWVCQECGHEFG